MFTVTGIVTMKPNGDVNYCRTFTLRNRFRNCLKSDNMNDQSIQVETPQKITQRSNKKNFNQLMLKGIENARHHMIPCHLTTWMKEIETEATLAMATTYRVNVI